MSLPIRPVRVLSDHVANQIAAGEVVERPESVVKELVENALDAGATRVRIEIEDGGQRLIRVLDDGSGMSPEDAVTSLLRHATSKVETSADLRAIATLGFRGEALPSIRSVSRFSMRTRLHGAAEGVRIVAHGADEPNIEPCGGPAGTEITVEELFYNVPARRKFLKQASTESQRIRAFVDRIALGWPEVHFTLVNHGKVAADYPADGNLQGRILAALGRDVCRRLHRVELAMGDHRVDGYASEPTFTKPNSNWLYTYINGRYIKDRVVQHAITSAYGPSLERGDYPLAVLFLFVPPEAVDVNVHPNKAEVRFVESGSVHGLVTRSLRLMLNDAPWGLTASDRRQPLGGEGTSLSFLPLLLGEVPPEAPPQRQPDPAAPAPAALVGSVDRPTTPELRPGSEHPSVAPPTGRPAERYSRMRRLGVTQGRFLLADGPLGLVVIDIAAAVARVIEHRLVTAATLENAPSQALLFPEPITLSPKEHAFASAEVIARLGFGVEAFGGTDVLLSAVPGGLPPVDPSRLLRAALGALAAGRGDLREVAEAVALQAAPLPGEPFDDAACAGLMRELDGLPSEGPGRQPVTATMPANVIERWFPR